MMKWKVRVSRFLWDMAKHVGVGNVYPRFYGYAWSEPWHDEIVAMPIPLNIIVRYARLIYFACQKGLGHDFIRDLQAEAYKHGRAAGYNQACLEHREREMKRFASAFNRKNYDSYWRPDGV